MITLESGIVESWLRSPTQKLVKFLASPQGISSNILDNRLKLLEELGLVTKQPYSSHSRRMNYQLTQRDQSLRPVLKAMTAWRLRQIPDTKLPKNEPQIPYNHAKPTFPN